MTSHSGICLDKSNSHVIWHFPEKTKKTKNTQMCQHFSGFPGDLIPCSFSFLSLLHSEFLAIQHSMCIFPLP